MSVFTWDPVRFDVLVDEMNRQHRAIVDAMNKVGELHERKAERRAMLAALEQLGKVTTLHFKAEEEHMQRIGFPDLPGHQRIHAKLLKDFGGFVQTYAAGNQPLPPEFFGFLTLWLSSHIRHIDRKYGEHGSKASPRRTGT